MRKVLSILLSALMTLCVFSVNVMALDETPEELSVKVRYVVNTDPVLTVPSEMTIFKGEKFNPLDVASAKDAEDGNITASIKVDGQFDVDALGSYVLTYSVTDRFGGTDTKTLKLNVIEKLEEGKASAETNVSNDAPVSKVEVDINADSILNAVVKEEGNKTSNLSPEQKQAIKDGADVNLQLTVNKTTEEASDDSKKIEDAVKSSNNNTFVGALLDINLLCTVISNNTQVGSTSKITETSEAVKISVTVPEELINNDPDVNRSFDVARLHDGIVELLGAVYDKDSKKLSFFSNKFSTYAIVYTDTKVEQSNNTSQSSSSGYKKPVVNTGYGFNAPSIEILGNSASVELPINGLPECNVLTVTYTSTLELKSADNKIVNANVEFVDKITKNDSYTLTVKLQENAAKPEPGIYEGTVTVSISSKEYEAKIGDTYIEKLSDAITTAQDGNTIKILKDIEVNDQLVIDKKLNLDLNKKTISYVADTVLKSGIVKIVAGGDLTINGEGKISTGDKAYAAIAVYGDGSDNKAKLTIENGTFQGYYYPIAGNGTCHNTEITINGGTFSSTEGLCIYHPQDGTLTINGGSFEGQESAIEIRSGNLTINDGTFEATNQPASSSPNGNGTTSDGVAIAIAQHTTKKAINVTIKGGTFEGYSAFYESNPQNNSKDDIARVNLAITGGTFNAINGGTRAIYSQDKVGFITGGTFSSDPSKYLANGYEVKEDGGKYVVSLKEYTFSSGAKTELNTVFPDDADVIDNQETLNERLSSAEENVTNTLYIGEGEFNINNVDCDGKTIVFVGSGYENTTLLYGTQPGSNGGEQGACYSFEGANVTFKDVTLQDVNGDDVNYKGFVRSDSLTFENCLLKSRMTYLGENGTVSFKNCTFDTPKYAAWIYSSQTYNFENCLFESPTGRFLNIYSEENIRPVINATECRFIDTSDGTDSNAVFNIKSSANTTLTIQDCVVTGASPLYKVGSDNGTTVIVDGITVYGNAN